jgi:capsular exopolysaccharide synthesis family protein
MGRIQEALQKSKNLSNGTPDSKPRPRRADSRQATHVSGLPPVLLHECAKPVHLDADALHDNRVVFGSHPVGPQTSYKMLRTRMLHRVTSNNWHRIAITSARAGAGKTLTTVNTAISLAREQNQRVILVDLDLRRPTVAKILGIEHEFGIIDYLTGNASMEQIVVKPHTDRLMVIPNFEESENSSELLSSAKMAEFVDIVSKEQNSTIVLFDLPPLLEADDFLAFSPLADAVLLVVAESETRQADVSRCMELMANFEILGLILNKSRNEEYPTGYYT